MANRYVRKEFIEAIQWDGYNTSELDRFAKNAMIQGKEGGELTIKSFYGGFTAFVGDWIVKDSDQQIYVSTAEYFAKYIEKV